MSNRARDILMPLTAVKIILRFQSSERKTASITFSASCGESISMIALMKYSRSDKHSTQERFFAKITAIKDIWQKNSAGVVKGLSCITKI